MIRRTLSKCAAAVSIPPSILTVFVPGCVAHDRDYRQIVIEAPYENHGGSAIADTGEEEDPQKLKRRDAVILKANTPEKPVEKQPAPSVFAAEHNARIREKLRGVKSDSERKRIIRENGGYEY